jgi:hypothetical protein
MKIAGPLVVKPDPFVEASIPSVRSTLHKVADAAKSIQGHYRFYAYTDASISSGQSILNAPDRGPNWWASKTVPTVCSSFIWSAVKSLENPRISLEGSGQITKPEELEPADIAGGAQVDDQTLDGLYMYDANERRIAGRWLHDHIYDVALQEVPWWLPYPWRGKVPDGLGNQMVNAFAYDWTGKDSSGVHTKDSDNWKDAKKGHAVSPDNILFWDAPTEIKDGVQHGVYGYFEKMIYRPETYEYREISR